MVNFSYKSNGEVINKEFPSVAHLILFVASNDIKDEDFVSIDTPMVKAEGIERLKQEAIKQAEDSIKQEEISELFGRLYEINNDYLESDEEPDVYAEEVNEILEELFELGVEEDDPEFDLIEVVGDVR